MEKRAVDARISGNGINFEYSNDIKEIVEGN